MLVYRRMLGDVTAIIYLIFAGLSLLGLIAAFALVAAARRRKRRQERLEIAFERSRRVNLSGSGIQGKPYSVYSEPSWTEKSRSRR